MQSPRCQMDLNNLSRVFGPTIVGHGTMEPSPRTIMKDTNAQSKVGFFLRHLTFFNKSKDARGNKVDVLHLFCCC